MAVVGRRSLRRCEIGKARERVGYAVALVQGVGLIAGLNLVGRRLLGVRKPVTVSCAGHRLSVRPVDSDPLVLAQIFASREYDAHPFWMERLNAVAAQYRRAGKVPVIVDAGANVGYSALYLADHFPDAVVLAVEPDERCIELIKRNCADNPRITAIHAALWSHRNGVDLDFGDHGSWANRVSDGGTTPSVTLESLLAEIPDAAPFIVKLDIEGAETEVCRSSPEAVASFVCIMVEPHDWMLPGAGGLSPLYRAVAGKTMDTRIQDETLMLFDCAVLEEGHLDEVSTPTVSG